MTSPNDFLGSLGDALNNQFQNSDSKNRAIDIALNGNSKYYGTLGDFSNNFDQHADRSYTEEGSFRTNYYDPKPKHLDILMQDPDITVLVKKRAFASLAENFRTDLMDEQETLFLRATKALLQNKCKQISAYEKLAKISVITTDIGRVDYNLLPIIFSATDELSQLTGSVQGFVGTQGSINDSLTKFKQIVDRVREIVAFSQNNYYTTWLTNVPDNFTSNFIGGTGVIEFTNVTSLSTTTSIKFGGGNFSLNFYDPYELMLITNLDIEQALNDATNRFYSNSYQKFGITALDQTIAQQKQLLNQARASRQVNTISFNIAPDPYLGQKVFAIIDNIGYNIIFNPGGIGLNGSIDPSALQGSEALGNQGLSPNEVSLFNGIVAMLYTQIGQVSTTRRQSISDNQDPKKYLNAIRKKLRLHYGNKLLIQPMDNVHIYISSKKRKDHKLIGGFQSSFAVQGFLQGLGNSIQDIKDTFAIDENYVQEKSIFVGNDFPNWLWLILRNQFISNTNGAHVFSGIVEEATSNYSGGVFTVSASGSDNSGYFNYGVVNFKPSVDVYNGSLYDPLTPFKLEFDSTTGAVKYPASGPSGSPSVPELLDENKGLFSSAFVKNKNGLLAGIVPSEATFSSQDADRLKNNSVRRVFYDPDGMVYRWKEGIATLVLFGDSYEPNPINTTPPSILSEPFAGQDIVNCLSLLITGEAYNFATFYKAAIQYDTFKRDPATNQTPSSSYFKGLQAQLKTKNAIYGDFIPFKRLVVDDASFTKMQNNQLTAIQFDADLQDLIKKRASLSDQLAAFGKTTANSLVSAQDLSLQAALNGLDQQIQAKVTAINTQLNSTNSPISLIGNDPSYDYDTSDVNSSGSKTRLDSVSRRELRRKLDFQLRRLAWKVRANEDVNYLVVDDTYDKDYDIQAFIKTPMNPEIFKSEYITVADKIRNVAEVTGGMEVFANTQGHIEVRNPKYNRMPSSVFYKMLYMKNDTGVQIFPQFLEDLYTNQIDALYTNIEVLEDEIRLYCLALGYVDDTSCASFINSQSTSGGTAGGFQFLSNANTGTITGNALNILLQSQPDTLLSVLQQQSSVAGISTVATASLVQSTVIPPGNPNSPRQFANLSTIQNIAGESTRQQTIVSRLQGKTGQTFDLSQLFGNTVSSTFNLSTLSSVDLLQIVNGISQRITQRQNAIKQASGAIKNVQEGMLLFSGGAGVGDTSTANPSLMPSLYNSRSIPQVFEHMIEDESYDDLGPGSARRYVIRNHDIIRYNISEKRPDFTSVEVSGRLGDQFIENNQLPSDLNVFKSGNALVTAAAVDYDMWRMYGMQLPTAIDAPWISDPDTQCAPYAVSLLNKSRKEILRGSIEIIGNEYQQPGEVIYLENRDLLFYVESVSHSFSYGKGFTTSMNITYGHNAGEYIPTFLDVIGKILYKNKDIPNYVHKRQNNVFNQEHLGTIVGNVSSTDNSSVASSSATSSVPFGTSSQASSVSSNASDSSNSSNTTMDDIVNGPYGEANRLALQTIIDQAGATLSVTGTGMTPTLEIRIYYNSAVSSFSSANNYAQQLQTSVLNYLTGANQLQDNSKPTGDPSSSQNSLQAFKSQIVALPVDSNPTQQGEFRYPSAKAFYFARKVVDTKSPVSTDLESQQEIDNVIYNYIVDCWIVFQPTVNSNNNQG